MVYELVYVGKMVYDQLMFCDIGVMIGQWFLMCNMVCCSWWYEIVGVFLFIFSWGGEEFNLIIFDDFVVLMEGGDFMVDKGCLLVGIFQCINEAGLVFLRVIFGQEFEVVLVYC